MTFYFRLILTSTLWSRCSYHPQLEMSKQRKVTFLNSRVWIKAAGFQSSCSGHLKVLDKTFAILTKELLKLLLTNHLNGFRVLGNTLHPCYDFLHGSCYSPLVRSALAGHALAHPEALAYTPFLWYLSVLDSQFQGPLLCDAPSDSPDLS